MRNDLLALGFILCVVGLIFVAVSQVAIKSEPTREWKLVAEARAKPSSDNMTVHGNLTLGDKFRVYFRLGPQTGQFLEEGLVRVNLTDPRGYMKTYDVLIGQTDGMLGIMTPYPNGTANSTGTYKAYAEGYLVTLNYLAFQKMELTEIEPKYPYATFLPVGGAVFAGGSVALISGAKFSKRRRRLTKHKR